MEVHHVTEDAETFTCNAFLTVGEDGTATLVDAGAWDGVVDEIRSHVDDVESVVMTHQHGDHVERLEAVVDAFDPDVYAYDDHPTRTDAIEDGDTVTIGDEAFDVVYTPGHADDHVSFVSESSLFSGDVVVHDDGAFDYGSFGRTDMAGQSRERLIESIEDLLERMPEDVEHMYAGHGGVFHGDVRDVVATALERAEKREPKYPDE
ncbi:beta-lactamase domain protein [Haloterrigena turkmenica DSM 5511]|uniref:Beta-lactamase domain protein n=1 Tax=Haloterrigena turkmenica (strain ATCC 51198 / DSM 5511 / JCM 9101 / NCIMB 13204 / VKM B-1734 / 4k) TaxID=543526 RepID=D2RZI3_HALTV|nr:MBL fold metallo-hydrolase [Haloterrigena turkmenica]ADB62022.1 beta-lactamase domain protein [Haloterrigena turkmenica DSM 5511]